MAVLHLVMHLKYLMEQRCITNERRTAERLGLSVLAKFVSFAVTGVPPNVMGIGPAFAIPEAVKKAGVTVKDIDIVELNEAFASQAVYCIEKLGLDPIKVNPKGGAIAMGHPLGCTGARQIATLLPELRRQGKRLGVVSMCIGTGMGAAAVIENEIALIKSQFEHCIFIWSLSPCLTLLGCDFNSRGDLRN